MTLSTETQKNTNTKKVVKLSRDEIAKKIISIETLAAQGYAQREIEERVEVARTTFQHWLKRKEAIPLDSKVVQFCTSPEGLAFLRELLISAELTIAQLVPGSVRAIATFIELGPLKYFFAHSIGAVHERTVKMEQLIVKYDREETARLSAKMKLRKIIPALDETFHPAICLVAMDTITRFILLEKYVEKRDAETWTNAYKESVKGFNIEVIKGVSDEGKAGVHCIKKHMNVHRVSDIFHVQYGVSRTVNGPLHAKIRKATKQLEETDKDMQCLLQEREDYVRKCSVDPDNRILGHLRDLDELISEAKAEHKEAQQALTRANEHKEKMSGAIKDIGKIFHPYNLETGDVQKPEKVSKALENSFTTIETVAKEASLSEASQQKIKKSQAMIPQLVSTLTFFFTMVMTFVGSLPIPNELKTIMTTILIPIHYLRLVAEKGKTAEERNKIIETSEILMNRARGDPFWSTLSKEQRQEAMAWALEYAQFFQRSSSCVEGRNGKLSLWHHGLHRLSDRKLKVLNTIANYFSKNSSYTTPAERFFGAKPRALFEYLVEHMPMPAWPAAHRISIEEDIAI